MLFAAFSSSSAGARGSCPGIGVPADEMIESENCDPLDEVCGLCSRSCLPVSGCPRCIQEIHQRSDQQSGSNQKEYPGMYAGSVRW